MEQARARGLALTPAEMSRAVAGQGENAGPIHQKVLPTLISRSERLQLLELTLKQPEDFDKGDWQELQIKMPQVQADLDKVAEAAAQPHLDFERRWELGAVLSFPELGDLKEVAKLLLLRSSLRLHQGDVPGTLDDIEITLAVARHAGAEPTKLSKLVGIAIDNMALRQLARVIEAEPTEPVLDRSADLIRSVTLPNLRHALIGETLMVSLSRDVPSSEFTSIDGVDDFAMKPWHLSSVRRAVTSKGLEIYTNFFDDLPEDPNDWQAVLNATEVIDRRMNSEKGLLATTATH